MKNCYKRRGKIILILTILFFVFFGMDFISANATLAGSYTLTGDIQGQMNTAPSSWASSAEHRKFNKYINEISFSLSDDGELFISTNSSWKELYNKNEYPDGVTTIYDNCTAGTALSQENESTSGDGSSYLFVNKTKFTSSADSGKNIFVTIGGKTKGGILSSGKNLILDGFGSLQAGTISVTLYIIYSTYEGESYVYDNVTRTYYTTSWTFQIELGDTKEPIISGVEDGKIYTENKTVSISDNHALSSWSYTKGDKNYTLNKPINITGSSTRFTEDGYYTITGYDTSNNSSTVKFIIDKTAPVISGVENDAYYSSSKTVTITDACTGVREVYINDKEVSLSSDGKVVISPKEYSGEIIIATLDNAENLSYCIFYMDTEDPIISGIENNAICKSATISLKDNYGIKSTKYSVNPNNYDTTATSVFQSGYIFDKQGYYFIEVEDLSGRKTNLRFIVDTTAPVISGVDDGIYYNTSKTLTFADNHAINRVLINGIQVSISNNKFTVNTDTYTGQINVEAFDQAGNKSEISFYIDTTAPGLSVSDSNVELNGIYYTNKSITITSDKVVDFSVNNLIYKGRSSITLNATNFENKKYSITATDAAGNYSVIQVFFDTQKPIISFKYSTENNNIFYCNSSETVFFSTDTSPIVEIKYFLNDVEYSVPAERTSISLSEPGSYRICATTAAGNTIEKTLIIDKTSPTLKVLSNGLSMAYNSYTNSPITVTFSDDKLLSGSYSYSFNSNHFILSNNQQFTEAGIYIFTVSDFSGNVSSTKITIEYELPIISGIEDGGYYNSSKRVTITDSISGIAKVLVNYKEVQLSSNSILIDPETYYGLTIFDVYDVAGNVKSLSFYMDNIAPTANISNKYYDHDIRILASDLMVSSVSYLKKDSQNPIFLTEAESSSINTFGDGKYTLYLCDKAGNEKTYIFYIDTIAPEGTMTGYTNISDNKYYANASSTLIFTFNKEEASATFNKSIYTSGKITIQAAELEDGQYELVLRDLAGNTTIYTIDLKSSVPTATITGYYSFVSDIYYANASSVIDFKWEDSSASATINGLDEYRNNFSLICSTLEEGEYSIRLVDKYNNCSNYKIIVDKTTDKNNYQNLLSLNASWINHWYNTYQYKYINSSFIEDKMFSFKSYEEADAFARNREYSTYDVIKYSGQTTFQSKFYGNVTEFYDYQNLPNVNIGDEVYIYKSLSNSSKIVVYFSYQNLYKALEHYISSSISEYYRYFNNSDCIATPYNMDLYYDSFYISSSSYTLSKAENTTVIYISTNGENYIQQTNKAVLSDGINYIRELDIAGNITEYIVILNQTPIKFFVHTNSGNDTNYTTQLNDTQSLYAASPITLSLNSKFPQNSIIRLTYTNLKSQKSVSYILNDGLDLNEEGTYYIESYDIFGNKSLSYTVYILYSADNLPRITKTINKVDGITIDLTFNLNFYSLVNNQITNILIKFTDVNGEVHYLTKDGNDQDITTTKTSFVFLESGTYEISVTDIFGNDCTATETLQKGAPFGQIFFGSPGTSISSGSIINQNIYFTFNQDYGYTCKLNGAVYIPGTSVSREGFYEFILSNGDTIASYSVTIDKTAPVGSLFTDGKFIDSNKTSSSHEAYFSWTEENVTALLNEKPYRKEELFTYEGKNIIILSDQAGNKTEYVLTLDWTAPSVKIFSGSYEVENGAIVNNRIKFVWEESNCIAYVNGTLYSSGKYFSLPGTYTLTISDKYGNSSPYYVTLDLSNPEFDVIGTNGVTLENGAKINHGCFVSWLDNNYIVYLDNNPYTKNAIIDSAQNHTISVTNQAGTTVTFSFSISYTLPTASIYTYSNEILPNGSITNQRFYLNWNDTKANRFSCTINGKSYTNGNIVRDDGIYEFILTDEYSNQTKYYLTRDTIAPIGKLVDVNDKNLSNKDVYFTTEEENCTIYLDGLIYTQGSLITEEGNHEIIIVDKANNQSIYTFAIDKTAPTFEMENQPNLKGYINTRTSITWTETNCTATLNDRNYVSGSKITDGSYTFELLDSAGNSSKINFIVDTNTPNIIIDGIDKNGNSNSTVYISWIGDYIVTVNDLLIENDSSFSEDGTYNVLVTSLAGNTNNYSFTISTVRPVGTLVGVENNGKTNTNVTFNFTYPNTATLNNFAYQSNTVISREGTHTIILTDNFGNQSIYTFEIDKTAPTATLSGVSNGKRTKNDVTAIFNSTDAEATLNGEDYFSATIISKEGYYELKVFDLVGNYNVYTFEIDKTAPEAIFSGLELGKVTNETVYISWNESNCTAYLNGKTYSAGSPIKNEGIYTFEIQDSLGNKRVYNFEIDKSAPTYSIYDQNGNLISPNKIINMAFYVSWEEESVSCYVNDELYVIGSELSDDGEYTFKIYDALGNYSVFTVTIDYSLPQAEFIGVVPGGKTNEPVIINFSVTSSATLNGQAYSSGKKIYAEGVYELLLFNQIGNSISYTFEIDTTPPTLEEIIGLNKNNYSNSSVKFIFDDEDAIAYLNGDYYYSGVEILNEGKYTLILQDLVGNDFMFEFEILKTKPNAQLIGVEDGGFTNKHVFLEWDSTTYTATLNGKNYSNSSLIREDGIYEIILKDLAGNESKYSFEISTKKPIITINGINSYNLSNSQVTINYSYCFCTVNGVVYSGAAITEEGIYTVDVIDKYGNTNQYNFEIDKTAPTFEIFGVEHDGFTNSSVYLTWDERNCTAYINNDSYIAGTSLKSDGTYEFKLIDRAGNISTASWTKSSVLPEGTLNATFFSKNYTNQAVSFEWDNPAWTATLNGNHYYSGTTVTEEGTYIIQLTNHFGNTNNYTFIIDTTAPDTQLVGVENGGFTNKKVIIATNENNLTIFVNETELTRSYITASSSSNYNGKYSIKVYDQAGNFVEYHFEYHFENLEENLIIEFNEEKTLAKLSFDNTCTLIVNDAEVESGFVLDKGGKYKLILTDKYGNICEKQITLAEIIEPNYVFRNVATITSVCLISGLIIFVLLKKTKGSAKNPYRKIK